MWALALGSFALAAGIVLLLRRPRRMPRHQYGKLVAETEPGKPAQEGKPALGPTYRNVVAVDGYPTLEGVTTLYELFQNSVARYPDNACLGHRPQVGFERLFSCPLPIP